MSAYICRFGWVLPIRKLGTGFRLLFQRNESRGEGQISPFNALMTALSATIGTGNIAGVATAVVMGGPGALFWMWMTALVGMATKYSEAVLAVRYREVDKYGQYVGGPMYYIKTASARNGSGWEHCLRYLVPVRVRYREHGSGQLRG